jgi:hypothetical protein
MQIEEEETAWLLRAHVQLKRMQWATYKTSNGRQTSVSFILFSGDKPKQFNTSYVTQY